MPSTDTASPKKSSEPPSEEEKVKISAPDVMGKTNEQAKSVRKQTMISLNLMKDLLNFLLSLINPPPGSISLCLIYRIVIFGFSFPGAKVIG
ncbi:hypothetical protein [Desulfonema ishimotonii]|uniref:hypothetical protein n=1 Tax=Desulfonema ishimotonii TaxID=45657 RepID=UPI00140C9C44|nr:hypothetical protein [Desulfonema ishimotonii]